MIKNAPAVLRFHGVRGSRPTHHPLRTNYGGNSTCIEFDPGLGFSLVVDAGSGLQHVTHKLGDHPQKKRIHILITHSHWDHILLLPLMRQLSLPDFEIHLHAPDVEGKTFSDLFKLLLQHGRLPIDAAAIKAKVTFHRVIPGAEFLIEGKIKVSTIQVNHQHVTLGYKITYGDSNVVILTDTASINDGNYLGHGFPERAKQIGNAAFETEYNQRLLGFIRNIETVVFDTHFNPKNLKPDWGHATPELAIEFCAKAGVRRVFMCHHAPEDNDNTIAMKQMRAREIALAHDIEVINAREEDEWLLRSA